MTSLAVSAPAVKKWYVSTASVPFTFGAQDAENGLSCVPEDFFTHLDDIKDYCSGYQSVVGETLTTRYFLSGGKR
jgi:hypothetical protein